MQNNSKLLEKLHDIHGVEGISIWPLAPGWWLVTVILIAAFIVVAKKLLKRRAYRKSWRYRLERELDIMVEQLAPENTKQTIAGMNDILKRLAMHTYGRDESAPLAGKKWLVWLANRDPASFNWTKKGNLLVEYPYMPNDKVQATSDEVKELAKAIKSWLRS